MEKPSKTFFKLTFLTTLFIFTPPLIASDAEELSSSSESNIFYSCSEGDIQESLESQGNEIGEHIQAALKNDDFKQTLQSSCSSNIFQRLKNYFSEQLLTLKNWRVTAIRGIGAYGLKSEQISYQYMSRYGFRFDTSAWEEKSLNSHEICYGNYSTDIRDYQFKTPTSAYGYKKEIPLSQLLGGEGVLGFLGQFVITISYHMNSNNYAMARVLIGLAPIAGVSILQAGIEIALNKKINVHTSS